MEPRREPKFSLLEIVEMRDEEYTEIPFTKARKILKVALYI